MGWTFTHRDKGKTNAEWFGTELSDSCQTILASATIGRTFYAAVQSRPSERDVDRQVKVWALVCPISWVPNDYYNFGYKDQDETCGPYQVDCPAKILDLLTPTDSEWANQWRQSCRDNIATKAGKPKVKKGDTIVFERPFEFRNGVKLDRLVFVERSVFTAGYNRYRIPSWKNYPYTVESVA